MRADADEAVRRFAAGSFLTPTPALMQGIARVLCGDLDGATSAWRMRSASASKSARPMISRSRCASDRWWQWRAVNGIGPGSLPAWQIPFLRRAGIEESFATPLICALRARAAMHLADVPAARRGLVSAQHLRPC